MKTCFQITERNLSYAKIDNLFQSPNIFDIIYIKTCG